MLAWGLIMTLMCLVNSYTGLLMSVVLYIHIISIASLILPLSARIFLGLAEAGLFPGKLCAGRVV